MELRKDKKSMKIKKSTNSQIDHSMEIKIKNYKKMFFSNVNNTFFFRSLNNLECVTKKKLQIQMKTFNRERNQTQVHRLYPHR